MKGKALIWILVAVIVAGLIVAAVFLLRGGGGGTLGLLKGLRYVPFKEAAADRWGLMDLSGNVLVDKEWENQPSMVVEGLVRVRNNEGKYEFFTAEQKTRQIGEKYLAATLPFEGLAAVVKEKSGVYYIDTAGNTVFELKDVDGVAAVEGGCFKEGMARFRTLDGKWGFINNKGIVVIKPKYDSADNFSEGLALVSLVDRKPNGPSEKRSGFIDKEGNEVIPLKAGVEYQFCSEGLIAFSDNEGKEWGYKDRKGEVAIKPKSQFQEVGPFIEGYATFKDAGRYGVIDRQGETVIRAKYGTALYAGGMVCIEDGGKWGFRDLSDKEVLKAEYQEIFPFVGNVAVVKERDKYILVNKAGECLNKKDYAQIGGLNQAFLLCLSNFQGQTAVSEWKEMEAKRTRVLNCLRDMIAFANSPTMAEMFPGGTFDKPKFEAKMEELARKYFSGKDEAERAFGAFENDPQIKKVMDDFMTASMEATKKYTLVATPSMPEAPGAPAAP